MYQFTGSVVSVGKTTAYGSKGFTKREIRLKESGVESRYPNIVPFHLHKDSCSLGDNLHVGDEVAVSFVLSGRVFTKDGGSLSRCFCENVCLRLNVLSSAAPSASAADRADPDPGEDMPF